MTTRRVPIIGIVGGIGSGKSALAAAFEELGCVRLDADKTGHQMLARAEVFCELVTEFGREILGPGDQVDRARLAAVAFASEQATRRLNEIVGGALWPEFRRRALEAADHAGQDVQAVVLDAALLYESQTDQICDGVVFVEAPDEVRRKRIAESRGWDWEEVRRREERQFALSRKRGMADEVCTNTAGIDHLRDQARRLLTIFRERFFSQ
ncbi:MAG: dephospho-CoA kinase [Anaerolineaceae bacterium]|nr:dephospho-CoA kinase [Anaerolineaceae bacterium]